jgi:hypothetical protein
MPAVRANHLTFLPDPAAPRCFLWGAFPVIHRDPVPLVFSLLSHGTRAVATLVDESLAPREHDGNGRREPEPRRRSHPDLAGRVRS